MRALSYALLPISLVYGIVATLRRRCARVQDFGVPIISVGNIVVGGTGKTPFIIELARCIEAGHLPSPEQSPLNPSLDVKSTQNQSRSTAQSPQSQGTKEQTTKPPYKLAIISRGYGRQGSAQVIVHDGARLLASVEQSGDEPYLIASALDSAIVIVDANRVAAIASALRLGATLILLDDGFRFSFVKFDILLRPSAPPYFDFMLPSGCYRERPSLYKSIYNITDGIDYHRHTRVVSPTERMLLVTGIANPERLDAFIASYEKFIVGKVYFKDHATFDEGELLALQQRYSATSLLITMKDNVKMQHFSITLSIIELDMSIDASVLARVASYLASYTNRPKALQGG